MKEMAKTKKSETCWKEYKRLKNKVTLETRVERVKRNITLNNWVNVKIEINPGKFLSLLFQIRVLHQILHMIQMKKPN